MIFILSLLISQATFAQDNGCKPETLARIAAVEGKLTAYSGKVDAYKKKYPKPFPPTAEPKSDQIAFCLSGGKQQAAKLALEGYQINDELESFAKSQGGACQAAAQSAFANIEARVNELILYTKGCP